MWRTGRSCRARIAWCALRQRARDQLVGVVTAGRWPSKPLALIAPKVKKDGSSPSCALPVHAKMNVKGLRTMLPLHIASHFRSTATAQYELTVAHSQELWKALII